MSSDDVFNGFDRLDSSGTGNPSDVLDFLNSSDNENELTDPPKVLENSAADKTSEDESANEDAPSLTLSITNVVVMASMRCHLRLKEIARSSVDVEYKALQNHVIMRLRSPYTVATIWSSGKIWCTGANSLAKAKVGARRVARRIAKCGFPCRFSKYKVVNIMATCHLPFRVRLEELVKEKPMMMSYEPELAPGLTFKTEPNSSTSLKLFSTGRIVIMGSSLDTISALVEELVPLAALHQTDEPVSDSDADEEQQKAEMRAATAAARQMVFLPEGLPLDELGLIEDEDEDPDADDYASDSDGSSVNASSRYRSGMPYSTDDSTDSGASIDSGGMSTRPKRRRKRRTIAATAHSSYTQSLGSILGSKSSQNCSNASPLHLMTAREAASLAFAKRASGDLIGARGLVAAAAEVRRQHELGELPLSGASTVASTEATSGSTVYSDPTWSRKAVASGSTKRACVVTYSGTEDSGAESAENMLSQSPQSNVRMVPCVTSPMVTPACTLSQMGVTATVANVPTSCVCTATLIPQQYVVTQTVSGLGQPIQTHTSTVLPQVIPYSTASVVSHSQPQVIRIAAPNTPIVSTAPMTLANPSGSNVSPAIYPIRLSGPSVQQAIIPSSIGPKIMSISPNIPTTTQFVNFNPLPNAQTYQVYQPNMFISSPAVFSTNGAPMQPGTATIFSGGNGGVFFSGMPAGLGPAVIQHPVAQAPTQYYQTYVGQTQTRLP